MKIIFDNIKITALLALITFGTLFAQPDFDSVYSSIKNLSDTAKITVLKNICWQNRFVSPKIALKYSNAVTEIAKKIKHEHLLAESLNRSGNIYRYLGEYSKAVQLHEEALKIAVDNKDYLQEAYSYNNLGVICQLKGIYVQAIEFGLKALKLFNAVNNYDGICFCELDLGNTYLAQGNISSAVDHYNEALKIREKQNNPEGIARAKFHIARADMRKGNIDLALKLFLELTVTSGNKMTNRDLGETLTCIAQIYFNKNDYAKSLEFRLKALDVYAGLGFPEDLMDTNGNIAVIYAKMNSKNEGLSHLAEAERLADRSESPKVYSRLMLLKAMYFENTSQKDSSIFYYKTYLKLENSINSTESISKSADIEAIYQKDKIQNEKLILEKDLQYKSNQNYLLLLVISLVILIAVILSMRFHSSQKVNRQLNELNAIKDTFFKLIAHDLRSPFMAILGFSSILNDDYKNLPDEKRMEYIGKIIKAAKGSQQLLENLLLWAQTSTNKIEFSPSKILISKLLHDTFNVLNANAAAKNIRMELDCPKELIVAIDEQMMLTVFRNLISNGIKFTNHNGLIKVEVKKINSTVLIDIYDNGIGMTKAQINNLLNSTTPSSTSGTNGEKGTGLGFILCKDFVSRHKGTIMVESELGVGTHFIISLPNVLV